jgi:chromate transporter
MIAYIHRMAVEDKGWIDDSTFRDGVALCQTLPGATAMQVAAYVGLRAHGIAGATVSYVGFGLPAFSLMMIFSALYVQTHSLPLALSVFRGLQAVIVAMVAYATLSLARSYLKLGRDVVLAVFAAGMFIIGVSPILMILLAAFIGVIIHKSQTSEQRLANSLEAPGLGRTFFLILLAAGAAYALLFWLQRDLFELAALMFRIDLFAFGGGFSSLALMLHEFVTVRQWLDSQTFLDGIALGQITPGPIVITATYIGYLVYGPAGGIVATVSVFLPSFLLVVGAVPYYDRLSKSPKFNQAVNGVFCSFVGLLASATFQFALNVLWDPARILLAGAALVALHKKIDVLWIVLAGAAISIIIL